MTASSPPAEMASRDAEWQAALMAAQVDAADLPDAVRARVFAGSEFVARVCTRSPELLVGLWHDGLLAAPDQPGAMRGRLAAALEGVEDEAALAARLRRFRNREMVRLVWRDLAGDASLPQTLDELSELADVAVRQSLDCLHAWACARSGVPRDRDGHEQGLIVLGMGKLGARELNMSSDIDLIFCFPRHGETDGARPLANETFFLRLGQQLIKCLGSTTVDGFVFRVDMRLRPFGDSGPMVSSFDAMESYYQSHAREWERYAMVKARALTGTPAQTRPLMNMLRAFVYRRYIDFGVIEAIRDMKAMIEREMHRKGLERNVKLGRGGIREIEFIGQAMQLVRGGRDPDLQVRPIREVLQRLGSKGLLPDFAVRELDAAYVFLRLVENRIQAWRDEQTHLLPEGEAGRRRIATLMGFEDESTFERELRRHRERVHEHFGRVFEAPQADAAGQDSTMVAAWHAPEVDDALAVRLGEAGFARAAESLQELLAFRGSATVRTLPARARDKLDQLMPLLLDAASQTADPDITLDRLLRLLSAIARRTAYLDLLVENPMALSQLVRLGSESAWVMSRLTLQPILLDELLDPRRLYSPLRSAELRAELQDMLDAVDEGDLEQEMERLRQFSQSNRLRVAAADITGVIPLMVVSDYLTEIAEVTLDAVHRSAWRDLGRRHGSPPQTSDDAHAFAVIGYGKLGGIELGYGSDLDLVFLHGGEKGAAMTDGGRPLDTDTFYARLGQRMIHMLTTRTPSGLLYEADMRLRPNGNSGMLVSSLRAFEHYQLNEAWTWEHQALVRARAVSGDPAVVAGFARIRREVLCRERDTEALRRDIIEMRGKMRDSLDKTDADTFHVKQVVGGLVDIEFLVQYAVLHWAHRCPGLVDWTDNARLLQRLAEYQLLEGKSAELLWNAYQVYRAATHRKALQEQSGLLPQDQLVEERRMVHEIWCEVLGDVSQA